MDYRECVDYIEHIPRFKTGSSDRGKSGNENLAGVLLLLGNPELKKKTVHIAGTNGKGSTSCFTRCILEECGYRVGVFTSPHLVRINERICTSQGDISDEDFLECFNKVYAAVELHISRGGSNLSFFEYLFAIAALYFSKSDIDYAIYETGLGGRLDATNLIRPVATAITSIGLDHTQYLGDTIEKIAFEKAGIIKHGVPVVYNTGSSEADHVIENVAKDLMAGAINVAKTDYIINEITDSGIDFSVHSSYYRYCNVLIPGSRAAYQVDNLLTAVCLCETLVGALAEEKVKKAAGAFKWPGRMEEIQENVYLDGAHNPDAMSRFVEACQGISGGQGCLLLFAASRDKAYGDMIKQLCDGLSLTEVIVTSLEGDRATGISEVAGLFEEQDKKVTGIENIEEAYAYALSRQKAEGGKLFCVGSLYLIGKIKEIAR